VISFFGVNFRPTLPFYFCLAKIFGINRSRSFFVSCLFGFGFDLLFKHFLRGLLLKVRFFLSKTWSLESNLKRQLKLNIRHLFFISSYRGNRHFRRLPCRGQRTKTNAQTSRRVFLKGVFSFRSGGVKEHD